MTLFNKLWTFNETIGTITIGEKFIEFRDQMKNKFNGGDRSDMERTIDADCLIIEYEMITRCLVNAPPNNEIRYDFSLDEYRVDVKVIASDYFNIPSNKLEWYKNNVVSGSLTHFAFYKFSNKMTRPFMIGDVSSFILLEVKDARETLKSLSRSNTEGYYYRIQPNCTQS